MESLVLTSICTASLRLSECFASVDHAGWPPTKIRLAKAAETTEVLTILVYLVNEHAEMLHIGIAAT